MVCENDRENTNATINKNAYELNPRKMNWKLKHELNEYNANYKQTCSLLANAECFNDVMEFPCLLRIQLLIIQNVSDKIYKCE